MFYWNNKMLNKKDVCAAIINKLQLTGKPITSNELSRQTKLPLTMLRVELNDLVRLGTIRSDSRYPCSYWFEADTPARTITSFGQTTNYDGAELRPYTGRPGSMDAYSLKSKGMV
jgi:hypothetical protein